MKAPDYFKELVRKKWLKDTEIKAVYKETDGSAWAVTQKLLSEKRALRKDLGKAYGDFLGIAYTHIPETLIQREVVLLMPETFARQHTALPLYSFGNAVVVALASVDKQIQFELENLLKKPVEIVFAFPDEIKDGIDIQYSGDDGFKRAIEEDKLAPVFKELGPDRITLDHLQKLVGSKAIVELSRSIILMAVRDEASDIHIDPSEDAFRIRFRIDGILRDQMDLDKSFFQPLLSRFKVLAKLDITDARKPQEGRLVLELASVSVEARIALVPTIHGEKAVLRILGRPMKQKLPDLTELGFSATELEKARNLVSVSGGLMLVTGPSGCGKSTTAYSILKGMNTPEANILTVEDPVEFRLPGINQVQPDPASGYGMADALKSFLRLDPDVILIGEIRDGDTARLGVDAALIGHRVLSTMHAANSIQSLTRLYKMGVPPNLLAPALAGVISQVLVRRLCASCKDPYFLSTERMDELFEWDGKNKAPFAKGIGCEFCDLQGYRGRLPLHEVFIADEDLRDLISAEAPAAELLSAASEKGFNSLWYDGVKKALRHLTSLEEVERVVI